MPTLYVPTQSEILPLVTRATSKWSQLDGYAQRAGDIVSHPDFEFTETGWRVYSQSDLSGATAYTISAEGCTCPSYYNDAPILQGRQYCKHLLAIHMYKKILTQHLELRLIGDVRYHDDRDRSRNTPNTYLLSTDSTVVVSYRTDRDKIYTRVCNARPGPDGARRFCTDADIAAFALWLGQAFDLPTPDPADEALEAYDSARAAGMSVELSAMVADSQLVKNYAEYTKAFAPIGHPVEA